MFKIPPSGQRFEKLRGGHWDSTLENGVAGRVLFAMQGPETRKLDPGDESSVNLATCATQTSFQCTKNFYIIKLRRYEFAVRC
jgi:hypothetical protein